MLKALYERYATPAAARALFQQSQAQVVQWRWATESMTHPTPFACEHYGGKAPRWLPDAKADPDQHVRHGFDAQGRVVLTCKPGGRWEALLHAEGVQHALDFYDGFQPDTAWEWREKAGRVLGLDMVTRDRGINRTYHWQGAQLQRVVVENWSSDGATWWCQDVYRYDDDGVMVRIDLEYLTADGQPQGEPRLTYLRPLPGETQATVAAEVERLLKEAIAAYLPRVGGDAPLYCLLLCYTDGDIAAAWPPFLQWARQPYRERVVADGEDVAYFLWAPAEMAPVPGGDGEHWFDAPALVAACTRHAQFMAMRGNTASAQRVLRSVATWLDAPEQRAMLHTTEDFVVGVADNTGNVDPLPGIRKAIGPARWAALKAQGYV